jgi:hypothetical protein
LGNARADDNFNGSGPSRNSVERLISLTVEYFYPNIFSGLESAALLANSLLKDIARDFFRTPTVALTL